MPERIGAYRVDAASSGSGGMGTVYLAEAPSRARAWSRAGSVSP